MSTQSQTIEGVGRGAGSLVAAIDRWFYVLMTLFLIAVILVGFIPDSFVRIADIGAGGRPAFLPQAHFHALTMASWMALLLTQTVLMATGRKGWHMQLGLAGMVVAPLMVVAGLMLVTANFEARIAFAEAGGPAAQAELGKVLRGMTNTVLIQLRSGVAFGVLVVLALAARRHDSELHKRLMILATIAPIGAALARMPFLLNTQPVSPVSTLLWPLVCLVPMMGWDLYRQRGVHRAYWIFLGVTAVSSLVVLLLWNTAAWQNFAGPLLHR
jgi:hypothetical protein